MTDIYNPWDLNDQSNPREGKCLNFSRLTQRGRKTETQRQKKRGYYYFSIYQYFSIYLNISLSPLLDYSKGFVYAFFGITEGITFSYYNFCPSISPYYVFIYLSTRQSTMIALQRTNLKDHTRECLDIWLPQKVQEYIEGVTFGIHLRKIKWQRLKGSGV